MASFCHESSWTMEEMPIEEQGSAGVLMIHTQKARALADLVTDLVDLGADLVPTAQSPGRSVLNHFGVEGQLSEDLTPPTRRLQTVHFLLEAGFKEIAGLPPATSRLETEGV